ncbi:MAG TPA: SCO family protein [Actinospica sp.]|jgi:protein SCO1/2|nr:SCO family protein [Actinospica sp.]
MQSKVEPADESGEALAARDDRAGRPRLGVTVGLWLALLALCAATVAVCKLAFATPAHAANRSAPIAAPGSGVGTTMDEALPASIAHLPLVDQNGHATDLAAFRGKVLMISDTMTLCQETCPLDTANLVQTARLLDADGLAGRVEFLTITIDPSRDMPAQLAAYRHLYEPTPANWDALTGSPQAIAALWKFFGVYIEKVAEGSAPSVNWRTGQKLTYDLDHSDEIFFVDASGTERFLIEGMGHVAAGTAVPETMKKYLDAQGLANLSAPASDGWTVPQALQSLSWLTQRPIPLASAS